MKTSGQSQSSATLQLLPPLVSVNFTGRASSSDSLPHQKLWKLGMLKLLVFDSSAELSIIKGWGCPLLWEPWGPCISFDLVLKPCTKLILLPPAFKQCAGENTLNQSDNIYVLPLSLSLHWPSFKIWYLWHLATQILYSQLSKHWLDFLGGSIWKISDRWEWIL